MLRLQGGHDIRIGTFIPIIHCHMPLRTTPLFRLGCFRVSIRWFCGLIAQPVSYFVAFFFGGEIWEP